MTQRNNSPYKIEKDGIDISDITIFQNDISIMLEQFLNSILIIISLSLLFLVIFHVTDLFGKIVSVLVLCILWVGVFLFIYQIVWQKRTVVLSPQGLQDSNVTTETIPWSTIESVRPLSGGTTIKRPWAVMLKLKPGTVGSLKFPRRTRLLRLLRNDELWIAFGFWTAAPGVRLSLDRFSAIITAYAKAYGQGVK